MNSREGNRTGVLKILSSVFQQSLNLSSRVHWTAAEGDAKRPGMLDAATAAVFKLSFDGQISGESFLAITLADLPQLELKDATTAAEATSEPTGSLDENALASLFSLVSAGLASKLYGSKPGSISCVRVETIDAGEGASACDLQLTNEDGTKRFGVAILLGAALIDSMEVPQDDTAKHEPLSSATNLDLVLDVELNVTLRFGQRQLPLREVLELKSGAVVELDRQVDEPVELVLDGKVIALGEAVIIDGNYGIRITQVVQPVLAY